MLTILLNPNRSEPLYQQICAAIREEIASGALQPNEKLPSRRTLSAHLQISIVTVQTAYEQLAAEGYLYSRSRAGYYVDPDAPLLAHMPKERVLSEVQLVQAVPEDQIVFSTSGVDLEQFPFSTWAKLSRQVLSTKQETLLQSPPAMVYMNCVRRLLRICGRFGIFTLRRNRSWLAPGRNIFWGFWCSCLVHPGAMQWKSGILQRKAYSAQQRRIGH